MNYKKPTKAIITDAGFASRYLPITKTIPKAMLPIGNKPIMQYVVEECADAGIEEIIIVATREGKPIYEDYFNNSVNRIRKQLASQGKEDRYAPIQKVLDFPKITVIEQDPSYPYGNGSPIASAKPFIRDDEAFVVLYSDDVVFGASDVKTLIDSYEKHPDAKAIIISQEMPTEVLDRYGIIRLKDAEKGTLDNIVEKPKIEDAPSNLTSYGRYLVTPEIFTHLDPRNTGLDGELWTVDAITKMAEDGDVYVEKTAGKWMTTGDPKNYFMTHLDYVLENEPYADEVRKAVK
ncbi:NTP transferase domain-containing protein [Candidatus Saccharibacteria bacterium]|nr:NTP transferase domain-containing protein [Candidatus Saccharibacteria bacterium]MBR3323737.1 NTP transferase domain-containing protein [Candidatus Saccharibacteria bacterium]